MRLIIILSLGFFLNFQHSFSQKSSIEVLDSKAIPFKMVKNTILIPVEINGNTYQFVFDTGGVLGISKGLQSDLQLEAMDSIPVSGVNKSIKYFDKVNIKKVKLGELIYYNKQALVIYDNSEYPEHCFNADGMIGRDFFYNMLVQFDYKTKTIRLTNKASHLQFNKADVAKMRISERGIPDIKIVINGKKQYVEFDSGSGDFFSYKTKDAERLKGLSESENLKFKGIFSYGVSSKNNIKPTLRYRPKVKSLKLGNVEFNNFYSNFSKASEPRIGASILYYGKTTLDFQNLKFYYEPYEKVQLKNTFKTFGFDIVYLNDKYLVKWVLQNSKAEQLGLKYGLEILSVNDKPISAYQNICDYYINGFEFEKSDKITIVVKNKEGEPKTISLDKIQF